MATSPICKIEGCGKINHARGWCPAHYKRWRVHGSPLAGGTGHAPKGELLRFYREVVLLYEGDDCLIWPYANSHGYGRVGVGDERTSVTRAVCEEVHGPSPTPDHEAAHSCGRGDDGCCAKRHLSWKTHAENEADKVLHGTAQRGSKHWNAKVTTDIALKIRALKGKLKQREIAEQFGVARQTVGKIQSKQAWAWL